MLSFDPEVEDRIIERFNELNSENFVNNKFYYLMGAYDQTDEEYTQDNLLLTACLVTMCQAISDNSTQDASKLFNELSGNTELAEYVANLLTRAVG